LIRFLVTSRRIAVLVTKSDTGPWWHPSRRPGTWWRARDLADAHYMEPLTVEDLAPRRRPVAAHFSGSSARAFGESPHVYRA